MNSKARYLLVLLFLLMPLHEVIAEQGSFEKLVMPGKLAKDHAEFEKDCQKCHENFEDSQIKLCLDCHEEIDVDLSEGTGFHGRNKAIKGTECRDCHAEHKGRNADIVDLDKDDFNHDLTDFPLEGKHQTTDCEGCHKPDEKYSEASSSCKVCHKEDDPHRGQFEEECDSCHFNENWIDTSFDHDETEFKLVGKHQDTTCNACHPDEKYKDTPMECVVCHALNDIHAGKNGDECNQCHSERGWDNIAFDHNKDTDFMLLDSHKNVSCASCHRSTKPKSTDKPPKDCIGCHQHNDEHQGRHGQVCDKCHQETKWSDINFNHDTDTDFILKGKHKNLMCVSCHKENVFEHQLETNCISCHKLDDFHDGEQGDACERCHNEEDWSKQIIFDHDITRFPLIGLHSVLPCSECHLGGTFQDTDKRCIDCHRDDDIHKNSLGQECHHCHTPNGWDIWSFDHNTQTDFILDGSHENISCDHCHKEPIKDAINLDKNCISCHKEDDAHDGDFGKKCEQCHTTEDFKTLKKR